MSQIDYTNFFGRLFIIIVGVSIIYYKVNTINTTHVQYGKEVDRILPYVQNVIFKNTNYSKFRPRYNETPLNFIDNPMYCQNSDRQKIMHPSIVLEDRYVVRDLDQSNLQREIIKKRAFDGVLTLKPNSKPSTKYQHVLPTELSYFYTFKHQLENHYMLGRSMGCIFQKYNHIPGMVYLTSKNTLIDMFLKYIQDLQNQKKQPSCIVINNDQASFFPETYRLNIKQECQEFFGKFNSSYPELVQKNGPEWVIKTDAHRGEGVSLIFEQQYLNFSQIYQNGDLCGEIKVRQVAQRYINKPYLYKQHKIEFRMYIYIASSQPLILYVYKRPLIKRCASIFNVKSQEISSHICNTAVVEKTMKDKEDQDDNTIEQDDSQEKDEEFIDWDFEGLQDLLFSQGRIKTKTWLQKEFYPLIYRTLIHMIRSSQQPFVSDFRFAEFLAVDFILDNNLRIWLLEVNFNPQILSVTPDRIVRNYKMIDETMEIAFAYIRSRYIRIKNIFNQVLIPYFKKFPTSKIAQETFTAEFQESIIKSLQDHIEPEFKLSENNQYQKIIDETQKGARAYMGYVDQQCV